MCFRSYFFWHALTPYCNIVMDLFNTKVMILGQGRYNVYEFTSVHGNSLLVGSQRAIEIIEANTEKEAERSYPFV